jgi:hypothetical protein
MVVVFVMARLILHLGKRQYGFTNSFSKLDVVYLLEEVFGFFEIVDSKFVGITIFMVSNYYTGTVNLVITTQDQSPLFAYIIILVDCLLFTFIPFFVHKRLRTVKNVAKSYNRIESI